jgi:uncharacterized protein YjiS (DUF1127 family)
MTAWELAEDCSNERAGTAAAVLARLRCLRRAARRRRPLHELDERMLRDIGLSRGDILLRTLVDDSAARKSLANTPEPAWPLMSRAAFALLIITLSIAATVLAA